MIHKDIEVQKPFVELSMRLNHGMHNAKMSPRIPFTKVCQNYLSIRG